MTLSGKTAALLALSSLILAAGIVLYELESRRGESLRSERNQLIASTHDLEQLRRNVAQYESTKTQIGESGAIARHERVALTSTFSPAELPKINQLLAGAYEQNGFLLLRAFDLAWAGDGKDSKDMRLQLTMQGEKVFTH